MKSIIITLLLSLFIIPSSPGHRRLFAATIPLSIKHLDDTIENIIVTAKATIAEIRSLSSRLPQFAQLTFRGSGGTVIPDKVLLTSLGIHAGATLDVMDREVVVYPRKPTLYQQQLQLTNVLDGRDKEWTITIRGATHQTVDHIFQKVMEEDKSRLPDAYELMYIEISGKRKYYYKTTKVQEILDDPDYVESNPSLKIVMETDDSPAQAMTSDGPAPAVPPQMSLQKGAELMVLQSRINSQILRGGCKVEDGQYFVPFKPSKASNVNYVGFDLQSDFIKSGSWPTFIEGDTPPGEPFPFMDAPVAGAPPAARPATVPDPMHPMADPASLQTDTMPVQQPNEHNMYDVRLSVADAAPRAAPVTKSERDDDNDSMESSKLPVVKLPSFKNQGTQTGA